MTTAEIESLLERVRRATGPDRELDAAIAVALPPDGEERMPLNGYASSHGKFWSKTQYGEGSCTASSFTASTDACIALIERVLPGWWAKLLADALEGMVSDTIETDTPLVPVVSRLPLALLEALLLVLLHQASKGMIDAD